jgi:predicted CoA-binding protein
MKTVAVIGASNDPSRYGNMAVRAFRRAGFQVFPVNPTEPTIEGLKAFPTINEVPAELDTVTIYVRPAVLVKLLPDIAQKGCKDLWLNPGTVSDTVLAEVKKLGLNAIQGCSILAIGQSPYAPD